MLGKCQLPKNGLELLLDHSVAMVNKRAVSSLVYSIDSGGECLACGLYKARETIWSGPASALWMN